MTPRQRIEHIVQWIREYTIKAAAKKLIVGVSGGVDSAVVSALCAGTKTETLAVVLPIHQAPLLHDRSLRHCDWLHRHHKNVDSVTIDLSAIYDCMVDVMHGIRTREIDHRAWANTRSRLRMAALYNQAQRNHGLVVGSGNLVENSGIGFFTKYGDCSADLSPIGGCTKTEIWDMARELEIAQDIIDASPTDGLWSDGRTNEEQIGMSYQHLERAMELDLSKAKPTTVQEARDLRIYRRLRRRNLHKMVPTPICQFR